MTDAAAIHIVIADSDPATRDDIVSALTVDPRMQVLGVAVDSDAAISLIGRAKPDVVLIDLKLPGLGGADVTEVVSALLPNTSVVMLSNEGGPDLLRKAMVAGARQFLLKPVNPAEVLRTVQQVYQTTVARRVISGPLPGGPAAATADSLPEGKVLTFFSPKGGVGRTTLLVNVAVYMAHTLGLRVAVLDGSLTFGDVGVLLDLQNGRSLIDLQVPPDSIDREFIETTMTLHKPSGVRVLLSPPRPEMADMVTAEQLRHIITLLRGLYDVVLMDTWASLDERVLTLLDSADYVVAVLTQEMTTIKNARMFMEVTDLLRFPPDKLILVATRVQQGSGISLRDIEQTLGHKIVGTVSDDPRLVMRSINQGEPFVLKEPAAAISREIGELTDHIVELANLELTGASSAADATKQVRAPGRLRLKLFSRA